ncbi:MAG: cellulase family glycosylhydrolase [Saprospiraceae bacterium]|nr:cellulase family glycosylhydrolase [Saprospiraceae bacterium]
MTHRTEVQATLTPSQYMPLLGKGMDVDWLKTGKGKDNYNAQTVKDFKAKGLSHVRIRIKDDANEALYRQLKTILDDCLKENLIPIVAYQGNTFKNDPSLKNLDAVTQWWKTTAEQLKDYDAKVSFDLLIEVTDALNKNPEQLNNLYEKTVTEIRKTNPKRLIFISPRLRSSPEYLHELKIPTQHNGFLMAEWHFYAAGPSKDNANKKWTTGTAAEKKLIQDKINLALDWQKKTGLTTWVGAWMAGDYNDGDNYSVAEQVVFANFIACALDKAKIPYAVNSDTKFYDRAKNEWIQDMQSVLNAILKPKNCP